VRVDRWTRPCAALLLAVILVAPTAADGEMCAGEYQTGSRRMSKAQRAREQAIADAERERAEQLERERSMAEETARLQEEARLATRPLGVRLVERRCGPCHEGSFIAAQRYGRPGWWATVLRMEWFNGARFEADERSVIVEHLTTTQGAGPARTAIEWALPGLAIALPLGAWLALRRKRAERLARRA
jgi:cytochrome c5